MEREFWIRKWIGETLNVMQNKWRRECPFYRNATNSSGENTFWLRGTGDPGCQAERQPDSFFPHGPRTCCGLSMGERTSLLPRLWFDHRTWSDPEAGVTMALMRPCMRPLATFVSAPSVKKSKWPGWLSGLRTVTGMWSRPTTAEPSLSAQQPREEWK